MAVQQLFGNISCFIFDIDGVLTDGMVLVMENGLQARRMNIKDGYALQLAVKKGYKILVVSGAAVSPVTDRLNKLGITEVHMAVMDKRKFILDYSAARGLRKEEVLFMGDDLPDLGAMQSVGLAVCPADAAQEIREIAAYISPFKGGAGCVRDVIEQVLKSRNHWQHDDQLASR